jgi:hypothetical protein
VTGAAVAATVMGAIPGLIFWLAVRRPDGTFPNGSEALVLVAMPVVAGATFALCCPRPVWRRSVLFTAVFGVLPALLTILVLYRDDPASLGTGPLAVVAAWLLSWFEGALPAGVVSRIRTWRGRGGTLSEWAKDWWRRRTCRHNWELVETQKILGNPNDRWSFGRTAIGHHSLYVYKCPVCGANKVRNDRWSPLQ